MAGGSGIVAQLRRRELMHLPQFTGVMAVYVVTEVEGSSGAVVDASKLVDGEPGSV